MGQFLKRLCNDGFLMGNLNGGIDLMENWLSSLSAVGGRAEKTIDAYRHDVSHFIHFLSQHNHQIAKSIGIISLISIHPI